jgi:hypothetical protein
MADKPTRINGEKPGFDSDDPDEKIEGLEDAFYCMDQHELKKPRCAQQCDECALDQGRMLSRGPEDEPGGGPL